MTEQTLRERLAEVRFQQMKGVTDDDVLRAEPILVQEHIYEEVDRYLVAVREWLESEAVKASNECEQDRKSITGGIEASPYLRGRYSALKALAQALGGQHD